MGKNKPESFGIQIKHHGIDDKPRRCLHWRPCTGRRAEWAYIFFYKAWDFRDVHWFIGFHQRAQYPIF